MPAFRLSPVDSRLASAAIAAYRLAVEYDVRVRERWASRGAELKRLDGWHRTRVAWENASFRAQRLKERAGDVLCWAVSHRTLVYSRDPFDVDRTFTSRDRDFVRALRALDEAEGLLERRDRP